MKIKIELKLHAMYEEWKKDDIRNSLVNKQYIAGIMKPKEIAKLGNARVFAQHDESKIKIIVANGDGAKWTKGGIYQKDQFYIIQEMENNIKTSVQYRVNRKETKYKKI